MFKPPSKRVRCPPPIRGDRPKEGSFLYDIVNSKDTNVFAVKREPIYMKETYLKALEKTTKSWVFRTYNQTCQNPHCMPPLKKQMNRNLNLVIGLGLHFVS